MDYIKEFITGNISAKTFIDLFHNSKDLQEDIRRLIPADAANNPAHPVWKCATYSVAKLFNFDSYNFLKTRSDFDNSLGDNLNIFHYIKRLYCFSHPEVVPTQYYYDAHGLFLDAVGDTYEGPEVRELVEEIIKESLSITPKKKRIQTVKQKIKSTFHVEGTNYPRWIQGAEWPMGSDSPMQYIRRERKGEQVLFIFRDTKTGEERTITQFY